MLAASHLAGSLPIGALLRDARNPEDLDLRVLAVEGLFVVVSTKGEQRRYSLQGSSLQRWLLPQRTVVAITGEVVGEPDRVGIVIGLHGEPDPECLWAYAIRTESGAEVISEQGLRGLKVDTDDPVARLQMNGWCGPRRFFARLCLLERTTLWKLDSEGIPALLGARIDPLFHQFYAARRCLLDRETRFLLADEVGLGKTIEAGLVVQSLLALKPDLRVLVVAPGTTSRQWLSELYFRCGGRVFTHVDTVRYEPGPRASKAMAALLHSDCLIVTTSLLRNHPGATDAVMNQHWDLLVVDEGHHLANWPTLATALRRVSAAASGCLVLTATPGRGDDKGLLDLLKLVAPATYDSVTENQFAERLEPQRKITEKLLYSEELIAALLARGEIEREDAQDLAQQWQGLFPEDPTVVACLAKMEEGDGEAAEELIAYIQENYRIDRRIIRTRRRTLGEYGTRYAARELEQLEYDPCPAEVAMAEHVADLLSRTAPSATWKAFWSRQICTTPLVLQQLLRTRLSALPGLGGAPLEMDPLAADLGPAEEEAAFNAYLTLGPTFAGESLWLEEALAQTQRWCQTEAQSPARFKVLQGWLNQSIQSGNKKTLVFSQSRPVIEELATYLRAAMGGEAVAVMTHDLEDAEIAEVGRRFERRPQCLVLLSDEAGAEGRNFQFADAVVHLDQPSVIARIEQRIGRLDRIGRSVDRPVLSVAVTGPFDMEVAALELHRDVFRVFERSIGGLEYLLPRIQKRLWIAAAEGAEALRRLAKELQPELEAEEKRIDEAFSFFLDATRPELERAKALANLVADRTGSEDESVLRDWCKELHIEVIPQETNMVKVEVRAERLDAPLPLLGPGDWVKTGTFLRSAALETPGVQYFAPGHRLVDALLQNALERQDACATAFFRDLGRGGRGRVFAVVIGRLGPDAAAWRGGATPGLLRRAEHYLPVEWVRSVFELFPNGEFAPVASEALIRLLTRDRQPTDLKCKPDQLAQRLEGFDGFWASVRDVVVAGKASAIAQKQDELDAAAQELEEALRSELAYLRSRAKNVGTVDTTLALQEREALLASVKAPAVITDSLAIVIGWGTR